MAIRHIIALLDPAEAAAAVLARATCLARYCGARVDYAEASADVLTGSLGGAQLVVLGHPQVAGGESSDGDGELWHVIGALGRPTWVVGEKAQRAATPIRKVLFATDPACDPIPNGSLPLWLEIARAFDAEVFVFHAWQAPGDALPHGPPIPSRGEQQARAKALRRVAEVSAALRNAAPDLRIRMNVQRGSASERIADEVRRVGADVITLRRGRTRLGAPQLGHVTQGTLRRVSCSMLIDVPN